MADPQGCGHRSRTYAVRADLAGVPGSSSTEPEAVAAALGGSIHEAFGRWHSWGTGQRDVLICGKPGVTAEDYEAVARIFAAAGVAVPGEEPPRD
ncbi:MAG TPA: hypothetical protein VE733_13195 [Streptosporangiaceae bacterium]|nr:hypothetical protein [Streptosporangiaceae bacterium]